MRDERRGAAGIRAMVTKDGIVVNGWRRDEVDASLATQHLRADLQRTKLEPGDLDGDFDYLSVWCTSTGEVDGGMWLRALHGGCMLRDLVGAADAWLSGGGLVGSAFDSGT